ncbi:pilus assembly protein PilM [Clostridium sp. CX1]|uniref:pilus assembly protein PilM n=1 Tax=Clostridium sp. CX1 TaxID=2978346 RepID=UPI0021BE3332|nr:pilus assembly protein PilM [Clostridium sp. CX1]MCT8976317.1 pilus assembly protein PilM [Clostridium sp. CX1]
MSSNRKLIFSIKDNSIDIVAIAKRIGEVKLLRVATIKPHTVINTVDISYNSDENSNIIKTIRNKSRVKTKEVDLVLSVDGIITRNIETPIMKRKELESFIKNNINDYFAVNLGEYYYDFEIIEKEKAENKDKKGRFHIILAAVPKYKLDNILEFINICGLIVKNIRIYPQVIKNIVDDYRNTSIAILDTDKEKSNVTIFDNNKLFLYSNILSESHSEENSFQDMVENFGYFLNFYDTRHFGNRVQNIFITGEFWDNRELYQAIKNSFGIEPTVGIEGIGTKITSKVNENINIFADIIANSIKPFRKREYSINFARRLEKNKSKSITNDKNILIKVAAIALLITIIWTSATSIYFFQKERKYNTAEIENKIASLSYVEKTISDLNNQKNFYETKIKYINQVANEQFDYVAIIETLQKGLPKKVTIKSITLNNADAIVIFNIQNSTIDVARLVIAINEMNIFEPVEVDEVKLDDSVSEASFNLKIKESEAK